jgi:hypothetical protein
VNKLTIDVHDLCKKMLSNKTSLGVGIIIMEEALVPRESNILKLHVCLSDGQGRAGQGWAGRHFQLLAVIF